MKGRFLLLLLPIALLLGVACGGDSDDGSESGATGAVTPASGTAAAATSSAPAELRDVVIGVPADGTVVSGPRAGVGIDSPNANIYETLIRMTSDYQLQPWLAERWEFREPNTWRFYLRRDVKFSDGTPMTAKDVVFTMDRLARQGGRTVNAQEGGTVAVDDYTVDFTPRVNNRKVPQAIVHPLTGIMKADSDPVNVPVGTGPFKFVEYRAKESLKVERNEAYWNAPNAAKAKSITFKFIPDDNARVLALRAGDVDIITQVPRESVAGLKSDSKFKVLTSSVGAYEALSINIHGEGDFAITADKRVREAIARAVDRDAIVKEVLEGNAETGRNLPPPAILGTFKDRVTGGPKFDLDGAKKLLDDAGWRAGGDGIRSKDGKRLELVLVCCFPDPGTHRPIPEVIQTQLRRAGIDVKIQETSSYDDTLKEGKGHLWLERGNQNDANPAFLPNLLYTSIESGNTAGEDYARLFAPGAKVDEPMKQAQATADVQRTQELSAQALKVLVDDEVIIFPIAGLFNITAQSARIEGYQPHAALVHTDLRGTVKR
jgi:peptide/nickel transport system substrate-binding protein